MPDFVPFWKLPKSLPESTSPEASEIEYPNPEALRWPAQLGPDVGKDWVQPAGTDSHTV